MNNYDIVYFVKDSEVNEELVYSLRSVDKNFPHRRVIFAGGKPNGVTPDKWIPLPQNHGSKWSNVGRMLLAICLDNDISDKFFIFNDDFFVLKPIKEWKRNLYYGTLSELSERIKNNRGGRSSNYTSRLEDADDELNRRGYGTRNFELHLPMLVDKLRLRQVYEEFYDAPCKRSLYGNKFFVDEGGEEMSDVKTAKTDGLPDLRRKFASSSDMSFRDGVIGQSIRNLFPDKSRFED